MGKASLLMFGSQFFEVTYNSESLARSWCTPPFAYLHYIYCLLGQEQRQDKECEFPC